MAVRLDLKCQMGVVVGDDWAHRFAFEDPDGVPLDLSDRTYRAQIRAWDGTVVADMTTDVDGHEVTVGLPRESTESLVVASGMWWGLLEVFTVDGAEHTVFAGAIEIRAKASE